MPQVIGIRREEFEILDPVIVMNAVHVVNDFQIRQDSPQMTLHHKPVFAHIAAPPACSPSSSKLRVFVHPYQHIAALVSRPPALPIRMTRPAPRPASSTLDPMALAELPDRL
jgi:hypothetical protein